MGVRWLMRRLRTRVVHGRPTPCPAIEGVRNPPAVLYRVPQEARAAAGCDTLAGAVHAAIPLDCSRPALEDAARKVRRTEAAVRTRDGGAAAMDATRSREAPLSDPVP